MNPPVRNPPPLFLKDEFAAGVTACLRSWSALRTAVESGWGGTFSVAKADTLKEHILSVLDGSSSFPPKSLDLQDLEDNLAVYMEEEFSVTLEDSSERQVAGSIWQMYEQCCRGDPTLASHLVGSAQRVLQEVVSAYPVQVQATGDDDESDDEETGTTRTMMDTTPGVAADLSATAPPPGMGGVSAAEYGAQSVFGKPKKAKEPRKNFVVEEEMVDEDGFATVTKTRRKTRK